MGAGEAGGVGGIGRRAGAGTTGIADGRGVGAWSAEGTGGGGGTGVSPGTGGAEYAGAADGRGVSACTEDPAARSPLHG